MIRVSKKEIMGGCKHGEDDTQDTNIEDDGDEHNCNEKNCQLPEWAAEDT